MLEKLFGFDPKTSTVKTEVMAGITTFLTMAYILAVNPNILGETGMDKGALFTTTVIMSALPTIFMGLYAKLPLALAQKRKSVTIWYGLPTVKTTASMPSQHWRPNGLSN